MPVGQMAERIVSNEDTEGVTVLGGEPLQQAESLLPLLRAVRDAGKSVFLYTGYELEELDDVQSACMELADIAVTGRYLEEERDLFLTWRGSSNQQVRFLTERYSPEVMNEEAREVEVHLGKDGSIAVYGYPDGRDGEWIPGNIDLS